MQRFLIKKKIQDSHTFSTPQQHGVFCSCNCVCAFVRYILRLSVLIPFGSPSRSHSHPRWLPRVRERGEGDIPTAHGAGCVGNGCADSVLRDV